MNKFKKIPLVLALIFVSVSAIAGPAKPGLIKVSKVGYDRATIEWKPSSHEERITYEVNLRKRQGEGDNQRLSEWAFHDGCCLTKETSVTIDNLIPETMYEIRIVAWSAGGLNSPARMKEHAFTTLPKPVLYQRITPIPTGFSMISIPFKYMNQTVPDIFGSAQNVSELTIYKFSDSGFTINSYDKDFGEWDDSKMILKAGEAVWVLNSGNGPVFWIPLGHIPNNWRILSD